MTSDLVAPLLEQAEIDFDAGFEALYAPDPTLYPAHFVEAAPVDARYVIAPVVPFDLDLARDDWYLMYTSSAEAGHAGAEVIAFPEDDVLLIGHSEGFFESVFALEFVREGGLVVDVVMTTDPALLSAAVVDYALKLAATLATKALSNPAIRQALITCRVLCIVPSSPPCIACLLAIGGAILICWWAI